MPTTADIDRLESQVETLKTRLAQAEASVKTITRERDQAVAARYIASAARDAGVVPAAIEDVVQRALATGDWTKDRSGELVRHIEGYPDIDHNGDKLTAGRFINSLREQASFYWAQGAGQVGGGNGNSVPGVDPNAKNPWFKDTWDDMAQAAVYRANPAQAEAMAKAAGSRIGALKPN
jgi:hypothetical protein